MVDVVAARRAAQVLRPVARAALEKYGVACGRLSFLGGGKQPAFRVSAGNCLARASRDDRYSDGGFLLRIFPAGTRTPAAIRSELRWLKDILSDTRLVVPKPVLTGNGDSVVTVSLRGDQRLYHCALTHWVKGRVYIRDTGPGPHAMRLVGSAMALLHTHGQQFKRASGFRCPRWDWEGLFGEGSPYFPDVEKSVLRSRERRLYSRVIRQCRAAMEQLGIGQNVFGLVHGDLIQLNYLFHKGEVRIIDFGDLGIAHYVYDMAVTLFALLDLDTDGTQRRAFIEGYREVRGFSDEHENILDVFLAARGVLLSRFVIGISGEQLSDAGMKYIARVTNGIRSWMSGRRDAVGF